MNKSLKVLSAVTAAALVAGTSVVPAFAASNKTYRDTDIAKYANSVGSTAEDIKDDVSEDDYGSAGITGDDYSQQKQSEYQKVIDGDAEKTVEVYATQASGQDIYNENGEQIDGSITALIPKVIILNGATGSGYSGDYTVKVRGNIAGDEVIKVNPKANTAHTGTDANGAGTQKTIDGTDVKFYLGQSGKKDIIATVDQAKTNFVYSTISAPLTADNTVTGVRAANDFTNSVSATGTVTAEGVSAGSWHGTFNFDITLQKVA